MKGIMLQDGSIRAYIEGYYTADDDHIRAEFGAYIIGYLEACFELGEWIENELGERKNDK